MKVTIYELATRKPHTCEPVDARELIQSGAYAGELPPETAPAAEAPKLTKKQQADADKAAAELETARKAAEALGGGGTTPAPDA